MRFDASPVLFAIFPKKDHLSRTDAGSRAASSDLQLHILTLVSIIAGAFWNQSSFRCEMSDDVSIADVPTLVCEGTIPT